MWVGGESGAMAGLLENALGKLCCSWSGAGFADLKTNVVYSWGNLRTGTQKPHQRPLTGLSGNLRETPSLRLNSATITIWGASRQVRGSIPSPMGDVEWLRIINAIVLDASNDGDGNGNAGNSHGDLDAPDVVGDVNGYKK